MALTFARYTCPYMTGSAYAVQHAACQMDESRWIGNMDINIRAEPEPDWWMGGPIDAPDHIPTGVVESGSVRFTHRAA